MIRGTVPGFLFAALMWSAASAGDLTTDAAIGGAIGGAVGGVIGAELGGREGAILGAGVGAAAGASIGTSDHAGKATRPHGHSYGYHSPPQGRFCPPGQAKKGRC
ncbi:MAG: glycine zipper 2TM domain-containing protein [Gammaproteobacteria bacterium]